MKLMGYGWAKIRGGVIGSWVNGWEERMFGCSYFNNRGFGLKEITVLRQDKGSLWCDGCYFRANTPETKLYSGAPEAKIHWGSSGIFPGFDRTVVPTQSN